MLKASLIQKDTKTSSNKIKRFNKLHKKVFLITSTLHISNSPLSYKPTRSVFSEEERIMQTKQSVDSILLNFPESDIFIIDNSKIDKIKLQILEVNSNVKIVNLNSKICHFLSKTPYKGIGEAYVTLVLLDIYKDDDSEFLKLSGRYELTSDVKFLFPIRGILFREINKTSITVFYGIGTQVLKKDWYNYLLKNLKLIARGRGIEEIFYSFTSTRGLTSSPNLFAQGMVSVDGSFVSF